MGKLGLVREVEVEDVQDLQQAWKVALQCTASRGRSIEPHYIATLSWHAPTSTVFLRALPDYRGQQPVASNPKTRSQYCRP